MVLFVAAHHRDDRCWWCPRSMPTQRLIFMAFFPPRTVFNKLLQSPDRVAGARLRERRPPTWAFCTIQSYHGAAARAFRPGCLFAGWRILRRGRGFGGRLRLPARARLPRALGLSSSGAASTAIPSGAETASADAGAISASGAATSGGEGASTVSPTGASSGAACMQLSFARWISRPSRRISGSSASRTRAPAPARRREATRRYRKPPPAPRSAARPRG